MTDLIALPLAVGVALAALFAGTLTRSGAIAAALCGWIALSAGWDWAIVLITYFISAALVSRFSEWRGRSETLTSAIVAKTGARDAAQVLANGGVFMLFALVWILDSDQIWLLGALSALATSAADTFATEIGTFSQRLPRSILSGQPVPKGTSGGISWLGTGGAFVGAFFVSTAGYATGWSSTTAIIAFIAGMVGMLIDSLLGATIQARKMCPVCQKFTERAIHSCGTATHLSGGVSWVGNDLVNGLATISGALIAMVLGRFVGP